MKSAGELADVMYFQLDYGHESAKILYQKGDKSDPEWKRLLNNMEWMAEKIEEMQKRIAEIDFLAAHQVVDPSLSITEEMDLKDGNNYAVKYSNKLWYFNFLFKKVAIVQVRKRMAEREIEEQKKKAEELEKKKIMAAKLKQEQAGYWRKQVEEMEKRVMNIAKKEEDKNKMEEKNEKKGEEDVVGEEELLNMLE